MVKKWHRDVNVRIFLKIEENTSNCAHSASTYLGVDKIDHGVLVVTVYSKTHIV